MLFSLGIAPSQGSKSLWSVLFGPYVPLSAQMLSSFLAIMMALSGPFISGKVYGIAEGCCELMQCMVPRP